MLILLDLCYGVYLDGTAKKIMDRANNNLSVKPDYKGDFFYQIFVFVFIYLHFYELFGKISRASLIKL